MINPTQSKRTRKRPHREPLLKPADVAAIFDVEPETAVDWAKAGKIAAIRTPGGQWRFRPSDVEALLASGLDEQAELCPQDVEPTARPVLVGPDSEVKS